MRTLTTLSLVALLASLTAIGSVSAQAPAAATGAAVAYEGKLQDSKRRPIGGVFPLTFSLYRSPQGGKAVWSESHFVAVDSGKYLVDLGYKRPIPPTLPLSELFLAVSITGGEEILRERIDAKAIRAGAEAVPPVATVGATAPAAPTTAPAAPAPSGRAVVSYAEEAGLAYEAEHAKVADRVGNLTEEAIVEQLKGGGGKATVGTKTRYSPQAGGEGGVAYEVKCPKGMVVTGVRGGAGIYLDSIQLICSPLE